MEEVVSIELSPIPAGITRTERGTPALHSERSLHRRRRRSARCANKILAQRPIALTARKHSYVIGGGVHENEVAGTARIALSLVTHSNLRRRIRGFARCTKVVRNATNGLLTEQHMALRVKVRTLTVGVPL